MIPELHLAMHGVAIKKHGAPADVASVSGLSLNTVSEVLASAEESGRVVSADGKYMLSPAGQMILAGEYSRFYDRLRGDADFGAACERFEVINKALKQLITDWQTLEIGGKRVANDHSDSDYDQKILDRLGDLHERFEPVMKALCSGEGRLATYQSKLSQALGKAEDGDLAWVSDAQLEGYHTVWFEMHEDLLRLLGRSREE